MKFILGYKRGTKSSIHPGPKLIWHLVAQVGRKRYEFERCERDDNGILKPILRIYDSADYPDNMIESLLNSKQIVEWHGDKIMNGKVDLSR